MTRYRGAVAACFLVPLAAFAQDSREVREPVVPPDCRVVDARPPQGDRGLRDGDTARIQEAIDACEGKGAVRLRGEGGAMDFHTGPLELRSGVVLVVDRGVTLIASSHPADYDLGRHACGTNDLKGHGCLPLIYARGTKGAGIMGEGTIDGRGGAVMAGHTETWWQLARRAQGENSRQNVPRLLQVERSRDFSLRGVTLRNSPNFHVVLERVEGFTAWGITIDAPADARNTDGIDPISSRDVTIAHSTIRTGDDSIAIKAGKLGPTENVTVRDNRFYAGHGMSIGSETEGGVRHVRVERLTIDGATSGLRIKSDVSRGGEVRDVRYEDVCMRGVRKPIDIDTRYDAKARGSLYPDYRGITLRHVRSVTGGRVVLRGYDERRPLEATLDDVVIDGEPVVDAAFARLALGPGPVRPLLAGPDVAVEGKPSDAMPWECDLRFTPFPEAGVRAPSRPQLSEAQARDYDYAKVVSGKDGWDPLGDPLVKGPQPAADFRVDASGKDGAHRTLQGAVDAAIVRGGRARVHIRVEPGTYRELLYVPASAPPITLWGAGGEPADVRIGVDLDAATSGAAYGSRFAAQFAGSPDDVKAMFEATRRLGKVSTPGSAIAWVQADGFQARNLTFANEYNRAGGDVASAGAVHSQAVAMRVQDADRVQFEQVRFEGYQDTLYLQQAKPEPARRVFLRRSYVEGDMDFIFGEATAYFLDTEIRTLGDRPASYAAAPSTHADSPYGFVFERCRFTSDGSANAQAGRFKLARQWFRGQRCTPYGTVRFPEGYACTLGDRDEDARPRGTVSRAPLLAVGKMVVLRSAIGAHIDRASPWSDWNVDGTARYRPAQFDSNALWDNLAAAGIDPAAATGHATRPEPSPFLAEFHDHDP